MGFGIRVLHSVLPTHWQPRWDLGFGICGRGVSALQITKKRDGIWDLGFGIWDLPGGGSGTSAGIWDLEFGIWDLLLMNSLAKRRARSFHAVLTGTSWALRVRLGVGI